MTYGYATISDTTTGAASVIDLVHVWLVPTDQPPTVLAQLAPLLDEEERRRASSHHSPVQRARFVAAHGAARRIVAAHLGVDPTDFTWRRGQHGKPEPDLGTPSAPASVAAADLGARISISTSSQVALVTIAQPGPSEPGSVLAAPREVGIDIERLVSDHEALRLAARFFPPDQAEYVAAAREHGGAAERFATLWCRKEACVKARGGRLVQGLGLAVHGETPLVTSFPRASNSNPGSDIEPSDSEYRVTEYRVTDVPAPKFFRAAVALKGAAPYRLRCHVWSAQPQTLSQS